MIRFARQGLKVARLKGGDPFIFGRGGEEIEILARHGIPHLVVPGITAALGAAASAGIPLTQRGVAQSVTLITGHVPQDDSLDWRALAREHQTVVFYMSVGTLGSIVARLRAAGARETLPAALIEHATLPGQRVLRATLERIADLAQRAAISPPALLIVGDVVAAPATGLARGRKSEATLEAGEISAMRDGFVGSVGNTPLIRLRRLSEETGCEVLGKAEFMNPGGSVKDRAARGIVLAAERNGELAPGGTVVEGTAGNTGIGLAHVCNARGYRCVIVMPDNQSPEKYRLLETLGAELHKVPAVPYSNPNQYQKVSQRLAASLPNAIWANQFDNTANRQAHLETTGPEIWEQTSGRIDAFIAATGTGGTFAGVSEYLKSRRRSIRCVLADPPGSSLYEYVRNGALKATGSGSITEGIGIGRVTANLQGAPIDDAVHVEDADTVRFVYRLLREEGLFLGSTSGINVAAAVHVARELGPGHTIVTVLCDGGAKYQSRLFDPEWLRQKGFAAEAATPTSLPPIALDRVMVA